MFYSINSPLYWGRLSQQLWADLWVGKRSRERKKGWVTSGAWIGGSQPFIKGFHSQHVKGFFCKFVSQFFPLPLHKIFLNKNYFKSEIEEESSKFIHHQNHCKWSVYSLVTSARECVCLFVVIHKHFLSQHKDWNEWYNVNKKRQHLCFYGVYILLIEKTNKLVHVHINLYS